MTKQIMDKAEQALGSARLLLEAGDGDGATDRAYYAMFYAATAALSWTQPGEAQSFPKTHGGLIASFGLRLVQAGHLPTELGRSLNRVHELRLTADYLPEPVPPDKAKRAVEEADAFIAAIGELLTRSKA
jgi:uncharacterized protein (UPF0332 family)